MCNVTTKQVLEDAREFHRQLSEYYRQLAEVLQADRIRVILDFLSEQEKKQAASIDAFEQETSSKALGTWLTYMPDGKLIPELCNTTLPIDLSMEEILGMALDFDNRLVHLFRTGEEKAWHPEVKDLFHRLLKNQQKEERELTRNLVEFMES